MPFVLQERKDHLGDVQEKLIKRPRRDIMNWILDTYSNVYQTAMMQSKDAEHIAAPAKERTHARRTQLLGLFKRR
jgi:hypothetical protein